MNKMKEKTFSIITAVYNTAEFLDDAIQSVINQTVGIECIQLILVNDASTDNSLDICNKWAKRFDQDILVINQEVNQGVSAARNAGIKHAIGKYVSFLDSDDKYAPDVCEKVEHFFVNNEKEDVDIVALPIIFFDGETGPHLLNNKFAKGTRVINLDKEWNCAQNFVSSTFVRAEVLAKHMFDQRMPLSEDLKFVQEIILRTHKLGVISDTEYLYRRRTTGQQSAIQTKETKRIWYTPTLKNGLMELADMAIKQGGSVPKYLQFLIMYELQWRISKYQLVGCPDMTRSERKEYYSILQQLLSHVENDVIMVQQYISKDIKTYAKLLKQGWTVDILFWCRKTRLIKLLNHIY